MGKRYKKHNVGRKKKNKRNYQRNEFYKREQKLNELINKFMDYLYHKFQEDSFECYEIMNNLRLEIKRLFDMQGRTLHRIGAHRRYVYYDMLAKFKFVYTSWKKKTYCIYIINFYDLPQHLLPFLKYIDTVHMKNYYKRLYNLKD